MIYVGADNPDCKGDIFAIDGDIYFNDYYKYLMASSISNGKTHICNVPLTDLEPYTEPTEEPPLKITAADSLIAMAKDEMDIKDNNMETKELNLCEILKGHESENFFSPIWGDCSLVEIYDYNGNQPTVKVRVMGSGECRNIVPSGHLTYNMQSCGQPIFYPSRALYEQYPLDPCTAWMKWREEQKKYWLGIESIVQDDVQGCRQLIGNMYFRTPADRDKCIEEIKSVIGKYSN